MKPWVLPAFAALVCWGIWAFFPKITVRFLEPRSAILYETAGGMLIALGILTSLGFKPGFHWAGSSLAVFTGFCGFAGAFFYLIAVRSGPVSLIAIVTALYPILTLLLAWLILHETLSLKQVLGMVLGLVAIYLLTS